MLAERAPIHSGGRSPLAQVQEVFSHARRELETRGLIFFRDLGALVSHQQHLEGQTATKGNNAELAVIPPAQLDNKVNPPTDSEDQISPSLEEYLKAVL